MKGPKLVTQTWAVLDKKGNSRVLRKEKKKEKRKKNRAPSALEFNYNLTKVYLIRRKRNVWRTKVMGLPTYTTPLSPLSSQCLFTFPTLSKQSPLSVRRPKKHENKISQKKYADNRLCEERQHKNRHGSRKMQTRAPSEWPTYLLNPLSAVACSSVITRWITLHNLQMLLAP